MSYFRPYQLKCKGLSITSKYLSPGPKSTIYYSFCPARLPSIPHQAYDRHDQTYLSRAAFELRCYELQLIRVLKHSMVFPTRSVNFTP